MLFHLSVARTYCLPGYTRWRARGVGRARCPLIVCAPFMVPRRLADCAHALCVLCMFLWHGWRCARHGLRAAPVSLVPEFAHDSVARVVWAARAHLSLPCALPRARLRLVAAPRYFLTAASALSAPRRVGGSRARPARPLGHLLRGPSPFGGRGFAPHCTRRFVKRAVYLPFRLRPYRTAWGCRRVPGRGPGTRSDLLSADADLLRLTRIRGPPKKPSTL